MYMKVLVLTVLMQFVRSVGMRRLDNITFVRRVALLSGLCYTMMFTLSVHTRVLAATLKLSYCYFIRLSPLFQFMLLTIFEIT